MILPGSQGPAIDKLRQMCIIIVMKNNDPSRTGEISVTGIRQELMMMNETLYELLEAEFTKHRIEEEVEDVLLDLAEMLAETNTLGKEVTCSEKIGRTKLEAAGICEADEEDPEEVSVYIKTLNIGGKKFEIEDYFL